MSEGPVVQLKSSASGDTSAWVTVDERRSIVFKVQACADAHIALSSQLGLSIQHTYEVVLGGWQNSRSAIRNKTQGMDWTDVSTPDILHCDEMRSFWISWEYGLIMVGKGSKVGKNEVMHWLDPAPYSVHAISVSTGYESSGLWEFSSTEG